MGADILVYATTHQRRHPTPAVKLGPPVACCGRPNGRIKTEAGPGGSSSQISQVHPLARFPLCLCGCIHVCVCVPRYQLQSCSNCEVQHLYIPLPPQTMRPEFHALQVGRPRGNLAVVCTPGCQRTTAPALHTHPRCTKTHIACTCALLLPASHPMHPCGRRGGPGGWESARSA